MIIHEDSVFVIRDNNTGEKYYAKGVYWHKKNIIIIAPSKDMSNIKNKLNEYPIRVKALAKDYTVEVLT